MTQIQYSNMVVNVPESWDDLTLKQYLEFTKVAETVKEDDNSIENTLRTYKLVEILTGMTEEELDEMSIVDMNDLSAKLSHIITNFKFNNEPSNHFNIDGVDYVAKNTAELDNGEYITLNILKEQYTNQYELFPMLLSVLVRPGKMEYDPESKKEIWEAEKFNRRDLNNMKLRADLFMEKALAKDVIPVLNFFLSMNQISL